MTRILLYVTAGLFLGLALVGCVAPAFLGLNLSPLHNLLHALVGAATGWVAYKENIRATEWFCLGMGVAFLLVAGAGLMFGTSGKPAMPGIPADPRLLTVLRGYLEFGTPDHMLHFALGLWLIICRVTARAENPNVLYR